MNIKKMATLTAVAAALTLTLSSCSTPEPEQNKEDTTQSQERLTSDEKPKDKVKAVSKEIAAFKKDTNKFVNLDQFDEEWVMIAPGPETIPGTSWFGIMSAEAAQKMSKQLLELDNYYSSKDPAPQTPEEQLKRAEAGAPTEDLLEMGGIITLEDGSTMTISVTPEGSKDEKQAQWSFFIS